jgi:hypothetical protein
MDTARSPCGKSIRKAYAPAVGTLIGYDADDETTIAYINTSVIKNFIMRRFAYIGSPFAVCQIKLCCENSEQHL